MITEEYVMALKNEINSFLKLINAEMTKAKDYEEIVTTIESLRELWNTKGGNVTVSNLSAAAQELASNNLASNLYSLSSEQADYEIKTLIEKINK